ncbi:MULTISPECIES: conjugal transfer protein TraB [unclassified Streptomyces]|uniref:conjugal transfer protein TraB n=1 Tax=unclassified Streptomyces TaxID=2593676 RepID=UPI00136B8F3B|nr:conjugal transfer protein TraB [Streptomyces sp. SID2563]MYW08583.1 conjugal transfer protein TraB [Streptomyces sp. SID2563]
MSDLVPRGAGAAPAPADSDNRYKAVQNKLSKLGKALDDAGLELESLRRSMQANASHTHDVALDIENGDLDAKFVEMASLVSEALGGAAIEVRRLRNTAQETADLTHGAKRKHASLYGALDDIRSNRRERTPRPGFFNR